MSVTDSVELYRITGYAMQKKVLVVTRSGDASPGVFRFMLDGSEVVCYCTA
jgi:hypothetical protein